MPRNKKLERQLPVERKMLARNSTDIASQTINNERTTVIVVSPRFFFLREFFSRALLSERLEQATTVRELLLYTSNNTIQGIIVDS